MKIKYWARPADARNIAAAALVCLRTCVCVRESVRACVLMCACAGASDALRGDAAAKGSPRESAQIYSPCFSCAAWHAAGIQESREQKHTLHTNQSE